MHAGRIFKIPPRKALHLRYWCLLWWLLDIFPHMSAILIRTLLHAASEMASPSMTNANAYVDLRLDILLYWDDTSRYFEMPCNTGAALIIPAAYNWHSDVFNFSASHFLIILGNTALIFHAAYLLLIDIEQPMFPYYFDLLSYAARTYCYIIIQIMLGPLWATIRISRKILYTLTMSHKILTLTFLCPFMTPHTPSPARHARRRQLAHSIPVFLCDAYNYRKIITALATSS